MFETAADAAIVELIEHLVKESKGIFTDDDQMTKNINRIAKLRASMNPIIQMPK